MARKLNYDSLNFAFRTSKNPHRRGEKTCSAHQKGERRLHCSIFGRFLRRFSQRRWVIRDFVDGTDLETILKNPSLCPSLRSPEKKMTIAVGNSLFRILLVLVQCCKKILSSGIAKGISHLHNLRNPLLHGDFKLSDVLISSSNLIPKITNFGLWDFKKFFWENVMQGKND